MTCMSKHGTAVVTGASSGIGEATARRLAADGFAIVMGARRLNRLEAIAVEIGAQALPLDVTNPASVARFSGEVETCDVLVNNAGGAFGVDSIAEADDERWQRMYDVNVMGAMRMTRALLPKLLAGGNGHVVMIGSVASTDRQVLVFIIRAPMQWAGVRGVDGCEMPPKF